MKHDIRHLARTTIGVLAWVSLTVSGAVAAVEPATQVVALAFDADTHTAIKGLSVPGMPVGAPGMPGAKSGAIAVYQLDASSARKVFASF
ncbi:MAG TPA: DUF411 domain-containing protein [Casimicrobiaceae bacterium]